MHELVEEAGMSILAVEIMGWSAMRYDNVGLLFQRGKKMSMMMMIGERLIEVRQMSLWLVRYFVQISRIPKFLRTRGRNDH